MREGIARGGKIVGGLCAVFFAFVAVGGALALGIAEPFNADQNCWPHYTALGIVRTECASPLADGVWYWTVEAARYLVVIPTLSIAQLVQVARTGSTHWLGEAIAWGVWGVPILVASVIGFLFLRGRAPLLAWALLLMLAGQIAFSLAPHVTGDLVEPM
jgi:hypothetical protein